MKCLHSGIHRTLYRDVGIYGMFYRPCERCGELLPLGPASDTEATAVEVRAAEIAVVASERGGLHGFDAPYVFRYDEVDGYLAGLRMDPTAGNVAGYLARCIATHTSGTHTSGTEEG